MLGSRKVIGGVRGIRLLQDMFNDLGEFGFGESVVSPFSSELAAAGEKGFRERSLPIGDLNARGSEPAMRDSLEEESEWPELILLVLNPARMLLE